MAHDDFQSDLHKNETLLFEFVCHLAELNDNRYAGLSLEYLKSHTGKKGFFKPVSTVIGALKREGDKVLMKSSTKITGVVFSWAAKKDTDLGPGQIMDAMWCHHFLLWQGFSQRLTVKYNRTLPINARWHDDYNWYGSLGGRDTDPDEFFLLHYVASDGDGGYVAPDNRQRLVWQGERSRGGVLLDTDQDQEIGGVGGEAGGQAGGDAASA